MYISWFQNMKKDVVLFRFLIVWALHAARSHILQTLDDE